VGVFPLMRDGDAIARDEQQKPERVIADRGYDSDMFRQQPGHRQKLLVNAIRRHDHL